MSISLHSTLSVFALLSMCSMNVLGMDDFERIEFFEEKIRPVLVRNCYECHSAKAEKLKAGLVLDRRAGWKKGGELSLIHI